MKELLFKIRMSEMLQRLFLFSLVAVVASTTSGTDQTKSDDPLKKVESMSSADPVITSVEYTRHSTANVTSQEFQTVLDKINSGDKIILLRRGRFWSKQDPASRPLKRQVRSLSSEGDSVIYYNNPKNLKMVEELMAESGKDGMQNSVAYAYRMPKYSERSAEEVEDGIILEKKQPLDRIDEPSEWRERMSPKFNRLGRRQPLDRIDEPNEWRGKMVPKFARVGKRQPLDRIDEPNDWKQKISPKFNRFMGKRQPLDRIDEPSMWRERMSPKYSRLLGKRQPLDRIDEPSAWRGRMAPKFNRYLKSRRGITGEEMDDSLDDKVDVSRRQPLDRIDEPSEWRERLIPKFSPFLSKRPA